MEPLEHNWERQREQLSALLDNELDEQEHAELAAHLPTCADCRAELESLQRARALLRALPQPALPRSFALSLQAAPLPAQPRQPVAPARTASGTTRRPGNTPPATISNRRRYPVRTLQWISTIAAVLGIVLLCSSAFSILRFGGYATSTSSNAAPVTSGYDQTSGTTYPTPRATNTQPGLKTPAPTTASPASTPPTTVEQHVPSATSRSANATSAFGWLTTAAGLGGLLLLLSACGFAIAWAIRRRW